MAEECTESSMATSSTPTNWWDLHSWNNSNPWHQQNPNSNSSCEEGVSISTSFTNASNHSGLTVESSRRLVEPTSSHEFMGETASDNHLWSQVLLSIGSQGELHNSQDVISNEIFEPACDYLKKLDNSWEFTNPNSLNNFEKHLNGLSESLIENERLTKLSNLVSHWSIAPPDPQTCNISLNSSMDQYSPHPDLCRLVGTNRNSRSFSGYGRDLKVENESGGLFPMVGDNSKFYYGNFADVISFSNQLTKPLMDVHVPNKTCLKSLNSYDMKKQGTLQTSLTTKINGRGQGNTNEGKKKRSEENSESVSKKPKHESSTNSSLKMQAPKVKIGERITALQQIVSPFGKTDTASVLLEAIGYIKILQEQVQLLSNPYMKTNPHKDPWGGMDRKKKGDVKIDLRSRGLCLVPISCTPQVYRDNTGSDYWTPTYRSCLYR